MRRFALIGALLACLALPAISAAAPGDLDETFDHDGVFIGSETEAVVDMEIATDGSIVVADNAGGHGRVARFSPKGDGTAALGGLGSAASAIAAIDLRADASVVVGGSTGSNDFALAELGPDGLPRCGSAGLCSVETDFAAGADRLRDVLALPGGLTIAAGIVTGPAGAQLGVARYLPNGTLDGSFSGDGKLILDSGGVSSFAKNAVVAVTADGSVLLAGAGPGPDGSGRGDLLLAKLGPDGDLDPSFGGGDGFVTLHVDGRDDAASIAVGPGGEIVVGIDACAVGLTTDCNPALARFTAEGELDSSFGSAGVVAPAAGSSIRILPNGFIFAAGTTRLREHFQTDFAVGLYLSNGEPDTAFSGDGVATADFGLGVDRAFTIALSGDGRPVLAGTVAGDGTRLGLARFEIEPGPPDAAADGMLDAVDRCPERFGANATGCPRIDRELELKSVRGGRLKAKISGALDPCRERQPVVVEVRRSGRWTPFTRGRTSIRGNFETERPVPGGVYRARARATVSEPLGRCASVRSRPLGFR